jgi:pilus assembly protein CpaC
MAMIKFTSSRNHVASVLLRSFLATTVALGPSSAMLSIASKAAYASDVETGTTEANSDTRLVRLKLGKSAVVKLPADASDVIVGNDQVVDAVLRNRNTLYLFAKTAGQTNIFVFDQDGQQIAAMDFDVSIDTLPLRKLFDRQIKHNTIKIDAIGTDIILAGTATSAEEAKLAEGLARQFMSRTGGNLINSMRIAGENQVMLKVKVIEIERQVLKQLGVDLQAIIRAGENVINLTSVNPFNTNGLLSPTGGGAATDNVGNFRFDSAIRAMEEDGLSRTLAEPNLTAISGQPAQFLAGGEFPYQDCNSSGCGVQFKPFGIRLNFTPTVNTNDRINLRIETEVSEIGQITNGAPSLNTRRATTTLETGPGGSMMIAGLIREVTKQNIAGTPGLKKLPVLGTLFRSRDFLQNETELVVIVTPYLVKPVREKDLVGPDKNFHPSGDKEAIFFGRLNRKYNASGKRPEGEYTGSVGYIVE